MNPILQAALGSILRWGLTILAGFFVKKGIWTDSDATTYVAAGTVALLTLGWSFWKNYKERRTMLTALTLEPGSTEKELKDQIKSGAPTPSIFTPPTVAPVTPDPKP